ncbi:MAG: cobalamin-dependent protein [Lachnospiraceae bacterium]|nr:cobalamin-dependent protein [Lachnospiraceae bacterium]
MKVLFFRPRPHKETIGLQNVMICEPLELEYLASNLESKGHETVIIDMILEKKSLAYFLKLHQPDVVGLTGYIAHVNVIKDYARQVKAYNPNLPVVVGGVHAEVNPEDFESEYIDYIVRANGIRTMMDILDSMEGKKDREALPCVYRKDGPMAEKETEFNYLFPARDKVNAYRKKYYYMFHRNCSLIKTSFGCPYSCKFCFCRQITDEKYFTRTLESIVEELEGVPETEIYIVDDDFLVNRERLLTFCDMLEERNIRKKYLIYGRADFIAGNEDVIRRFKEVGLRAVIVGLESCDSNELVDYNKKTNVKINEDAVGILKKYDVECYGTFILGLDWKKEDFKALGKWIKKLGLVFVNLQPLTPLRGTELYEAYRDSFIVREDEYEKWDLAHLVVKPTNISARKYYWYTIVLYYAITVNPASAWYMVKKYGLHDTLKLSVGAFKVNLQYFKKLIQGK